MSDPPAPHGADSFAPRLLLVLTAVVVVAQVLGCFYPNGSLWGGDAYAFLAPGTLLAAGLGLAATAGFLWSGFKRRGQRAQPAPSVTGGSDFWVYPLLAIAGAFLFGTFHSSSVLLGDGIALVTTLPIDSGFHRLEPLAMLIEQLAYAAAHPLLAQPGREPYEVAWRVAASLSVLAGAFFLPLNWAIARHLTRRVPGLVPGRGSRLVTAILFLVLVAQGYVQVFFGYVEVYALSAAADALFILTALRFLDDRTPLWPAALALGLAVSMHLAAIVLVPPFLVLVAIAITDRERRPPLARDALLAGSALAVLPLLLALMSRGYSLTGTTLTLLVNGVWNQLEPIPGYFGSWRHLRDFLNGQLLIGPLSGLFFLAVAAPALRRRTAPARDLAFFVLLGAGGAAMSLVVGDSNLGYARNWDLLAPAGLVLATAGMALLVPRLQNPHAAGAWLTLILAVSCFHTIPWIAVNASAARSLERFVTLPLELGRVESTVGNWHYLRGDTAEAERWFVRSLDQFGGNVRAHLALGDLYTRRGDHARACAAYRTLIELRPDENEYRLRLIGALVRAGAPQQAVGEAERLVRRQPDDPRIWATYGIVLLGTGRIEAARLAFASAGRHAPNRLLYRLMINYVDLPRGFERAVGEVLDVLIEV